MISRIVKAAGFTGLLLASLATGSVYANAAPATVVTHGTVTCQLQDLMPGLPAKFWDCVHTSSPQPAERLLAALVIDRMNQNQASAPPTTTQPDRPDIYVFYDIKDWDEFFGVPAPTTGTIDVYSAQYTDKGAKQPTAIGTFLWGVDANGSDSKVNPIITDIAKKP